MPSTWLSLFLTLSLICLSSTVEIDDIHQAVDQGLAEVESMIELENRLLAKGLTVQRGSPAHLHSLKVGGPRKREDSDLNAARILAASTQLKNKLNWSADEARSALPLLSLKDTALKNSCPESITCPSSSSIKYRPIDGSCNNLARPDWGKVNTPFQRALPNAYADGVFQPRVAQDGSQLAGGRFITTTFVKPPYTYEDKFTLVLMSWGQFITHDLTKASAFTSADGKTPQCCNATSGKPLDPEYLHPFCLPIDIPENDYFYKTFNVTCMTFVRTQIGADYSCSMGHAEQLNGNTHWLDGSMIYGSTKSELDSVRLGQDGLLKSTTSVDGYELLPLSPSCSDATCYYAGDVRAQENPQLAILHTLMMREHNRIARALKKINPKWDEETLFEETRRIVIAQVQHITYTEYLPAMLGEQAMRDYKLTPAAVGTFTQYNETTASDPSVWNEFAAAVFRVGHSQVLGNLALYDSNDAELVDQGFVLSNFFFDASQLPTPGFIDNAIRGLTKQIPFSINPEYTMPLVGLMFKGKNDYGLDLVALNVQRGREHGIPDYNTVRGYCGLKKAATFDDLLEDIQNKTLNDLKLIYKSVNDIDLYIGCLAETSKTNGALMGRTGLCIISEQFEVTKNNDRFFYDVGNQGSSFTLAQLDEIRKTSLARIMCDNNNGNVTTMQLKAFRIPDAASNNARQKCDTIPSMNLTKWMDPNAQQPTAAAGQTQVVLPLFIAAMLSLFIFY